MDSLVMLNGFEFQPLRAGQVSVALDVDGQANAYRSVPTASGELTWVTLERASLPATAAIAAFSAYRNLASGRHGCSPALASPRQMVQWVVHRASILAIAGAQDVAQLAKQAIDEVCDAALGRSVAFSLERLPRLGLDIGYSANRHALQLVVNLAEARGCAFLLDDLVIQPCAHAGAMHAQNWLRDFATAQILNDLSSRAGTDSIARQLITFQRQRSNGAQCHEASNV
ncbi:hypothetical protein ACEN2T_17225 [Pseudomonas sp. W22_MBD1_FP4]|uniref:hypothetical protein n=1 Tax=Pseudomonas sp. W22_MBD1_FP4 TaxID=3240272 RepID=UPI003F9EB0CC